MSHAKSHHDIDVRLLFVQHLRLQDWVTHMNSDLLAAFRNADLGLWNFSDLTAHTVHFKAVFSQKSCQQVAFL